MKIVYTWGRPIKLLTDLFVCSHILVALGFWSCKIRCRQTWQNFIRTQQNTVGIVVRHLLTHLSTSAGTDGGERGGRWFSASTAAPHVGGYLSKHGTPETCTPPVYHQPGWHGGKPTPIHRYSPWQFCNDSLLWSVALSHRQPGTLHSAHTTGASSRHLGDSTVCSCCLSHQVSQLPAIRQCEETL